MSQAIDSELIAAACLAREQAYAIFSQFRVGAALLAGDGNIYSGCNVENASYGLTICAERVALFTAVAAGQRTFIKLAIATAGGAYPCGACRQVLVEFARDLPILLINADDPSQITSTNLQDLLPHSFHLQTDN